MSEYFTLYATRNITPWKTKSTQGHFKILPNNLKDLNADYTCTWIRKIGKQHQHIEAYSLRGLFSLQVRMERRTS